MNVHSIAKHPLVLELNRVERLYTGGKLLDQWQGIADPTDGHWSEEFLVSTTGYIGHSDKVPHNGLSRTQLADGSYATIKELIDQDEGAFLGARYAGLTNRQAGVMARIGDSTVRLVIQAHPDRESAQKYLNFPAGKTEAWYILDSREIDGVAPHVYAGFKPGVTRETWRHLFEEQDVPGMLDAMHRFEVSTGDIILIEAGTPHAMGCGCLFLEIHEASDYTIRLEKTYLGREIKDETLIHFGVGYDAMFDMFHYDTYTEKEMRDRIFMDREVLESTPGGTLSRAIPYSRTDRFILDVLELTGTYPLPPSDGHYIIISTHGEIQLSYVGGTTVVPQGRAVFIPAGVEGLSAVGHGELAIAYPFKISNTHA